MRHFPLRATAASLVSLFVLSCGSGSGDGLGTSPPPPGNGTTCYATPPTAASVIPVTRTNCLFDSSDPLYRDQWHLKNCGVLVGGIDINVESVWASTKGNGVRIAVVDDGLEINHEDLAANVVAGGSYNYLNGSTDPTGGGHGTAVAGVAAALDLNNVGVRGVAPRASLVGYNLLQSISTSNVADAMTRDAATNSISSNSWGAPDGNGTLADPGQLWRDSITVGLTQGRSGRGTVYVWAAGNGATDGVDNSNYDGQANYRGVIAVGALTYTGKKATYSERGANLWVSAPAGEFCSSSSPATTTVDRSGSLGYNAGSSATDYADMNYTKCFNGTSSATPVVSGAVALMLQANSLLGWRDVRMILAETATKNDPTNGEWTTSNTTPQYNFNHNYGFGLVNAAAAVARAATWTNLPTELTFQTPLSSPNIAIPADGCSAATSTINVNGSGISKIEFIEVTFSSDHTYSGDLDIQLTSPSGTVSRLAELHLCNGACTTYNSWVFGSARHLGESPEGTWTLTVRDLAAQDTGTFQSWRIKIYGH